MLGGFSDPCGVVRRLSVLRQTGEGSNVRRAQPNDWRGGRRRPSPRFARNFPAHCAIRRGCLFDPDARELYWQTERRGCSSRPNRWPVCAGMGRGTLPDRRPEKDQLSALVGELPSGQWLGQFGFWWSIATMLERRLHGNPKGAYHRFRLLGGNLTVKIYPGTQTHYGGIPIRSLSSSTTTEPDSDDENVAGGDFPGQLRRKGVNGATRTIEF